MDKNNETSEISGLRLILICFLLLVLFLLVFLDVFLISKAIGINDASDYSKNHEFNNEIVVSPLFVEERVLDDYYFYYDEKEPDINKKKSSFNSINLNFNDVNSEDEEGINESEDESSLNEDNEKEISEEEDNDEISIIENNSNDMQENNGHIYVLLYVGNIDGSASSIWHHFYDRITSYYEDNKIPVLFSFFPAMVHNEGDFGDIFYRMYLAENIELAQKGFTMSELEENMHLLSVSEQKKIILNGRDYFVNRMRDISGSSDIDVPLTYVAPFSSTSENTISALEELGFRTSFGLYYRDEIGPINSRKDHNVIQYGVSFSTTGASGRDIPFKEVGEIINELKNYERLDVNMLRINGDKVIPLFVHQPDFEDALINGRINETKWQIYTETISMLLDDNDITLLTPSQAWELSHKSEEGSTICQYANSAVATSENSGAEAIFASGAPNADFSGQCNLWSGIEQSWNPVNWNVKANLTLNYDKMMNVKNFTIIGDYNVCWDRVWLRNSNTGEILNVLSGANNECVLTREVSNDFYADSIIIETCGWAWSSTDAVELCGISNIVEEPKEDKIFGCQYANSAVATSENSGAEAIFASGAPNADFSGQCNLWSGIEQSWNPVNWNVKANLTLNYDKMMNVKNFTIIGDYNVCWDRVWLRNSNTGEILNVLSGANNECVLTREVSNDFYADSIIIETCGWAWSSTDAVELCGSYKQNKVDVCDWGDCKKGAVSISVDDFYDSCIDKLDSNGFKGTYFLTNTEDFSLDRWEMFDDAFKKGHEIGTHSESHFCYRISENDFIEDMNKNIFNIVSFTSVQEKDIVSHAHPCGYTNNDVNRILKNNWNFLSARGYYFNLLEDKKPNDFFNLKSFNSRGYPGGEFDVENYSLIIDRAIEEEKWANLVFHINCDDEGVIDSLVEKDVWVENLGNVIRYINLRENVRIFDYYEGEDFVSFKMSVLDLVDDSVYSQKISLRIDSGLRGVNKIEVDGKLVEFFDIENQEESYSYFNVFLEKNREIDVRVNYY